MAVHGGLLLRRIYTAQIIRRNDGEEKVSNEKITIDYGDYRAVDGVKVPFTVRQKGGVNYTTRYTDIRINVPIDDVKFDKPSL